MIYLLKNSDEGLIAQKMDKEEGQKIKQIAVYYPGIYLDALESEGYIVYSYSVNQFGVMAIFSDKDLEDSFAISESELDNFSVFGLRIVLHQINSKFPEGEPFLHVLVDNFLSEKIDMMSITKAAELVLSKRNLKEKVNVEDFLTMNVLDNKNYTKRLEEKYGRWATDVAKDIKMISLSMSNQLKKNIRDEVRLIMSGDSPLSAIH